MTHSILLVDDHKIMRDGLRAILQFSGEFQVIAEAESGPDAVRLALTLRPDVVLMDIHLPALNGIEATGEILRHRPETRIAILSMYDDEGAVMQALRAGARAFVLKTASHTELLEALHTVARGGTYLSPSVSDKFLSRVQRGDLSPRRESPLDALTPRELQVMRLIAGGKTSKEIADILGIGVQTVRGYRKDLMRKLNVNNVAALTRLALDEDPARSSQLSATA